MKPFTSLAIIVFTLVALLQFLRAGMGWAITVDGLAIPLWASLLAGTIAAALAVMLWRESRA